MGIEEQMADPHAERRRDPSAWMRLSSAPVLCVLWVLVIVLAVAVQLAK